MVDARLRERVAEGEYWVDPGAVAEAILRRIRDDSGDSGVLEALKIHLPLACIPQDDAATPPGPA